MKDTKEEHEQSPAPSCGPPTWDANDPNQQEVSRITKGLKLDIMGVVSLGKDGIYRSLSADRTVLDAQPLSNEQIKLFLSRLPEAFRNDLDLQNADGTNTPKEKWFKPDEGVLPRPLPQEEFDKVKNMPEEGKERLRKRVREDARQVTQS